MFWLDNLNELFNPILYPNMNMTIDEKINAIIRLILFTGIIATLIFNDSRYILFIFIYMAAAEAPEPSKICPDCGLKQHLGECWHDSLATICLFTDEIGDTIQKILNIEPDKVYLHVGARKGMEILEDKGYVEQGSSKKKFIEIKDMPKPMQQLKAVETEHFLCSMKDSMTHLEQTK